MDSFHAQELIGVIYPLIGSGSRDSIHDAWNYHVNYVPSGYMPDDWFNTQAYVYKVDLATMLVEDMTRRISWLRIWKIGKVTACIAMQIPRWRAYLRTRRLFVPSRDLEWMPYRAWHLPCHPSSSICRSRPCNHGHRTTRICPGPFIINRSLMVFLGRRVDGMVVRTPSMLVRLLRRWFLRLWFWLLGSREGFLLLSITAMAGVEPSSSILLWSRILAARRVSAQEGFGFYHAPVVTDYSPLCQVLTTLFSGIEYLQFIRNPSMN